jgi:asparagine synthase (glutamine-hydrolysing)
MCGIAGFATADNLDKSEILLDEMLNSIKHRGPDGQGKEVNEDFSIGMRRLAIIDVASGWQPIYSHDKRLAIVLNGEIYNYQELWQELKKKRYSFTTDHSDTETVLHGYEEWGEKVVDHLVGMYAFVIYDKKRRELFIARDRLGIKPLYYFERNGRFFFASEIKALLKSKLIKPEVNLPVLYRFLMFRVHDNGEETFFKGIKRLLPGHYMTVGKRGIKKIKKYWQPRHNPQFSSEKTDREYADEFLHLFKKVVKRHLIADVPVGITLSGGLDSSGVSSLTAELMREGVDLHLGGKLHTFSSLYPNKTIDESGYIHTVERYIGSEPHYVYPKVEEFWQDLSRWIYHQEEPTISSAPYAYYRVYQLAHRFVKVTLSGNGGDELLAGYLPYFRSYLTAALDQKKYFNAVKEVVAGWDIYKRYFYDLIEQKNPFSKNLKMNELLSRAFVGQGGDFQYFISRNLNERLMQDVLYYSTPNLLRYEDKNSMAFSIEARVPFLDHQLVEYIFGLPIDQKIKNGWTRYVYRNAMKGRIPEKNRLRRSKVGFTNPELDWLKAKADVITDIFSSNTFKNRALYDNDKLLNSFEKWLDGSPGDGLIFWRIMVSELWMREFID